VTAEGRGLAVALMLVGIAAFGVLTAELVALFAGEPDDTANRQLLEVDARLGRIEDALLPMQRRYTRKAAQARSRNRRRKRRNRMIAPPRSAEAGPPALSQQSVLAHRSVPIVTSRRQEDRKSTSVASSDSAQSLR
jgi:hypothetical protein